MVEKTFGEKKEKKVGKKDERADHPKEEKGGECRKLFYASEASLDRKIRTRGTASTYLKLPTFRRRDGKKEKGSRHHLPFHGKERGRIGGTIISKNVSVMRWMLHRMA